MGNKKRTKGSVLVFLVITIALLIVIGGVLLTITISHLEIKRSYSQVRSTLYLAEGGLNNGFVIIYDLICEAVEDSILRADEYLLLNEDDESGAATVFANNYKLYIINNIRIRVRSSKNPYISIGSSSLIFKENKLTIRIDSKFSTEEVEVTTSADIVILIPDYNKIKTNSINFSNLIYFDKMH